MRTYGRLLKPSLFVGASLGVCATQADVRLVDSGEMVVLENNLISMTIGKSTGRATKLVHAGQSLLAPGETTYFTMLGAFDDDSAVVYETKKEKSSRSKFLRQRNCRFQVHTQTPEMVDLSFTPEPTPGFPFGMELHYVLREGESGFYFYVVASKPAESGKAWLKQLRFAMRLNDSMTHIRLTDELFGTLPDSKAMKGAKGQLMDATCLLQSSEWITKYDWACETEAVPAYGLHNGRQGAWIISGGNEYLNGGPTKQHNTCHATDKGPIILKLMTSSHFGSNGSWIEGDWRKIYGPVFVYLNSGESEGVLWADAKQQAAQAKAAWPFAWLRHPLHPLERARVTGRFTGLEAVTPLKGWVVLARPTEYRGLGWQQQGADTYIYRVPIQTDGSFSIPAVREGSYTLYAFADGIVGEFRKDGVDVADSAELQLGNLNWQPRSRGKLLWRIGVPDRTAKEFRHGDDYRHWGLWFKHPDDFAQDVDFTIGASNERRDWNYAQALVWESPDGWKPELLPIENAGPGRWRAPQWKVRFSIAEELKGKAVLSIGIAGSTSCALGVGLNGKPLQKPIRLENDSSLPRSGIRGRFREKTISFDASRLCQGENVLTLDLLTSAVNSGRRTNYPIHGILYDYLQLVVPAQHGHH